MRRQLIGHVDTEVNAIAALRRCVVRCELRRELRGSAGEGNGRFHGTTLDLSQRWDCGGQVARSERGSASKQVVNKLGK